MFKVRHNVLNITSVNAFAQIKGGYYQDCKDVFFVRALGANQDIIQNIENMDRLLGMDCCKGKGFYTRITELPKMNSNDVVSFYSEKYNEWIQSGKQTIHIKCGACRQPVFPRVLAEACKKIEHFYGQSEQNATETMKKNFIVKCLFWYDAIFNQEGYIWSENGSAKVVVANVLKKQEYLFWYMVSLCGCDVLMLQLTGDLTMVKELQELSAVFQAGAFSELNIAPYDESMIRRIINEEEQNKMLKQNNGTVIHTGMNDKPDEKVNHVKVVIPERNRRMKKTNDVADSGASGSNRIPVNTVHPGRTRSGSSSPANSAGESLQTDNRSQTGNLLQTGDRSQTGSSGIRVEKTYEELAELASSVVLIAIHDKEGEIIGSGSGIMIGKNGYILTNNHVACGGVCFSVKIEDDEEVYMTDEVIKYNQVLDLAVIRIDRTLKPLPIYKGPDKLVRGQRVVAIGSPLGLFNSVSDGIISGFRVFEQVDMIQFTAPISHGSSGGAVLNMYGEVIGISTGGFDTGQNINLAMGYECINMFVRGFTG